jgi:hypothetical protein
MYLTQAQREALQSAAAGGINAVNSVITRLRTENPAAFHSDTTLLSRTFLLAPAQDIPCRLMRRDSLKTG